MAYKKKRLIREAITAFNKSIELDPKFITPRYERFSFYMMLELHEKALEDGHEILMLDRDFMKGTFQTKYMMPLADKIRKSKESKKTPVTILTGFLGSGKTTLLNRILKENHGHKIAVVENEFGAQGIDQTLVGSMEHNEEQIIEVMNGCICCTVRADLIESLNNMKTKYIDTGKIDYIIIETTGMADPAPLLQTFLIDEELQKWTSLDACITVCDTSQIVMRMDEPRAKGCENESVEQVCFADKVLLNKIDLCNREKIDAAKAKVREYNTQCTISEVQLNNSDIPFEKLLNLKAFSIEKALEMDQTLFDDKRKKKKHDQTIGTFSFKMDAEMTMESANEFISQIVREKGQNIYRMKGFLAIEGATEKFVFHSVGMLFSCVPFTEWKPDEKRECVLVIIGKQLEHAWIKDVFHSAAIVPPTEVEEIKGRDHDHSHSHSDDDHSHDDDHSDDDHDDDDDDHKDQAKKKKEDAKSKEEPIKLMTVN